MRKEFLCNWMNWVFPTQQSRIKESISSTQQSRINILNTAIKNQYPQHSCQESVSSTQPSRIQDPQLHSSWDLWICYQSSAKWKESFANTWGVYITNPWLCQKHVWNCRENLPQELFEGNMNNACTHTQEASCLRASHTIKSKSSKTCEKSELETADIVFLLKIWLRKRSRNSLP